MRHVLLAGIICLMSIVPVFGNNIMKIYNVTATAGEDITVDLEIINEDQFVALQLDIPLPAGFDYVAGSAQLNPERKVDHQIQANILPSTNIFRCIAFSFMNTPFIGNEGVVASFAFSTPSSGGIYIFAIQDAVISDANAQNILSGVVNGTITLIGSQVYTVTFSVIDPDQNPISDAIITFNSITYSPGEYIIQGISPGEYDYIVEKEGYQGTSGTVIITYENVTVNVILEPVISQNIMQLSDITATAGENITVDLEIINEEQFVALQLDIPLPAGFDYIAGSAQLNPERKVDHQIQANILPSTNIFRCIAFSFVNTPFIGNGGIVASFAFSTPSSGGIYIFAIQDAVISNASAQNILSGVVNGTITLIGSQVYTVTFLITDPDQNPISDAIITFDSITYSPGDYVIQGISPGEYDYIVEKEGYQSTSGTIIITDENVTVNVILDPVISQNIMQLSDVTATVGEDITVDLEIINEDEFVAFQLDIPLPAGFDYVAGSAQLNPERKVDHQIQANILPSTNIFRCIAFSFVNTPFIGNEGVVASFAFSTPSSGGIYTFAIQDAVISDANAQNILSGVVNGIITLIGSQVYTVTFSVTDPDQNPISDAIITFDSITYSPGDYIIQGISPGEYDYIVEKEGYQSTSGTVIITDENVTVNVILEPVISQNIMQLSDVTATVGEDITVDLEIINEDQFVALQLDIPLPAGFDYIAGSAQLNPERKVDHQIQANILPSTNIFRCIAFSFMNTPFIGNEGIVASFTFSTPSSGGIYIFAIQDAVISNASAQNILSETIDGTITLLNPILDYVLFLFANPEEGGVVSGYGIYNAGDTVNISAIPNPGWGFINWTDFTGNLISNQPEYSFVMPAEDFTLIANFEMIGYTLTLFVNPEEGGTVVGSGIYNAGDTVNISAIPNPGWGFINWTDVEGNLISNQPEYSFPMPAEDLTLIANFEIVDYTLTLVANPEEGGTVVGSGIYNVGDTVNISAIPNTGWEFVSWTDPEGNLISNQPDYSFVMPAEDLILTANFEMTGYTLTLIANPEEGGTVVGSGIYNAGDTVNIIAIPNTGWNFVSWADSEGNLISNQPEYSFPMPNEDLTLIANFEMTGHILSLVANPEEGGTVVGSGIYNVGDTINIIAIPNTGWNFVSWTDSEGNLISNQPEYSFLMPAEDLILTANFEIADYTLTLVANPEEGGTVVGSGIYNVGDAVNIIAIPNTGWNFVSWTDSEGNLISNQPEHSFLMPAEDLILIANFEMSGYTLTLIANPEAGGTVIGSGIYNVGDSVNISAIPNTGWNFVSWTDSVGNFISNQPEHSFLIPAENLTLIANFEMTSYILTLVANPEEGGVVSGYGIYNAGDTVIISAITNTGWNFINWTDVEGNLISNQPEHSFLMPAEDLILTANFEMTGYVLTLVVNPEEGGTVVGSGIYNVGDTVNISAIPNTGWEFINWTDSEGNLISNQPEHSFLMPAEDHTLIANFEITGYTLTLVANPEEGGTVVGSGIYNAGDTVNISAISNLGWEFVSWTDPEGNFISNQPEHSFLMPAEDLILTANFEMTDYILTLVANPEEGGTVVGSGIYNAGDTVNISAIPNLGWEFINWTDVDGNLISNQPEHSFLMPAEDLTLIANFAITEFILTLFANPEEGGVVSGYGIYNAGDTVSISAIPNLGWGFINWTDSEGNLISNQPEHNFLMPAEDLILIANFEMTGYFLTLVANPEEGGTVVGSGIYNAGDTVNISAIPNTGWNFVSWTDHEGNLISNQPEYSFLMPAEDLTLIANFAITEFFLTLFANPEEGGVVSGYGIYNVGDTVNIIAIPNTGWNFVNWTDFTGNLISNQPEHSFPMPAEDLILIANFEIADYTLTLVANPEEGGIVVGSGTYNAGDTVNISAIPNTGWNFVSWTDSVGNLISNQPEYSFLMPGEDLTLIANFEMTDYTLTLIANPEEGGAVVGSGTYNAGDTVNISAIPNLGWEFINWTDPEGNLISNQPEYSFLMPAEDLSLIANFEMTDYILTLIANPEEGGTVVGSGIYNAGDTINISAIPNLGWEFINWTDSEGNLISNQPEHSFLMPAEDLILIANFEMTGYILILVADPEKGGTVVGSGIYNAGDTVSISAIPNQGWEFINWTDFTGNLISNQPEYSFLMPAEDLILTANFEMTGYVLTLISNPEEGGTVVGSGIYNVGDTVNISAIPNTGWNFVSWTDLAGNLISNQPEHFFLMPTENLTLFANFEITEYTLTLVANPEEGGTVVGSGIYNAGETVNISAIPNTGWEFINWTDFAGNLISNQPEHSFLMPAEDLILIANFEMTGYILTLIANPEEGGTVAGSGIYNVGDSVNISAIPNTGWNFVSWTDSEGNLFSNQPEHSFLMPSEDLILIANFEMTGYILTLIANPEEGGTVAGSGIYNVGDSVNISAIPNTGWNFVSWTDSEGNLFSNQPEHSFLMPSEDLILIANFEIVDYTLMLIANPEEGGAVVGSGTYNAGDTVNIIAIPNTGWNFVSWTDSEGNLISNQPEHSFLMPAENLTLIANFSITEYILTLFANPEEGGVVSGYGIYNVGDTVNIIAIPNIGWNFINWTDVEGNLISNQPEYSFLMPAEDLILISNFELTGHVLTLIANPEEGGTVVGSGIYNAGDTVNISAIPNTGWNFVSWTDPEGNLISNQPEHSFLMPAEDLTLVANFEITEYTLTLVANPEVGGIVLGAGTYHFGDEVNIYSFPNIGYTFTSWTDINGNIISTSPATVIIMPASNLTLFANFELIDYTLTLIANPSAGGIVTGAGNYNYGSIVNINAVPNAGYSFVNWTNLNGNIISTDPSATIFMPSNNLTLIANFQPISYTLTLIANPSAGGTVAGAGNYNYGSIVNINAVPNAGYTFVNWTNLQGNVISTDPTATISMPPNNLTLIANFEPVAYTLTLIANPTEGGTVGGGGNYNQGEIVIIHAIPNTGYNFVNWTNLNGSVISTNPDATFAMPDCNLTLIANFQLITYTVTFEIKDESNNPVIDAIITLGNMSNEPGDYTFENVAPGMYNYEITAQGYQNASGMVAVSQNEIFHIVLHKKMFNIMASAGENGFIEPFGIISVVYGGSQSFLIQANEGFHIADVLIDDVSIGPVSEYEFVNVTSNHSIHAIFEINTYTISVDVNNSDWGIVTGSGIYEHGQLVTLEAIAYSGYRFIEWREEGAVVSTDTLLVFTALNDRSFFAVFDLTDNISFVEYSDPVVSIYPNPAGDLATISFENSNVTVEAIEIFDIQGRQIAKYPKPEIANDKFILDVSNYISGAYMVQIITAEGVLCKRLIVF